MPQNYFLLKSEPSTYSFDDLERDKKTAWDGVRNHAAKLNLQKMQPGDQAFIYHSGDEKQVIGLATCIGAARPDPSDETDKFVCVDLQVGRRLKRPITLAEFRAAGWDQFDLVRMSRLSCMTVPDEVRAWILAAESKAAVLPEKGAAPKPKVTGTMANGAAGKPKTGVAKAKAGAAKPKTSAAKPKAGAAKPKAGAAKKAAAAKPKVKGAGAK